MSNVISTIFVAIFDPVNANNERRTPCAASVDLQLLSLLRLNQFG